MNEIVFFLEERCAEAMLTGLLPRFLPPHWNYRCVVFEGKQDLEKHVGRRIRGYRVPGAKFVVLRDKDAGDCIETKDRLRQKCSEAGRDDTLIRIACHELESWYLADLAAVERGLGLDGLAHQQNKKHYANPDTYPSPSKTICKLVPLYQKVAGSRQIGPYLDLENTRSYSFKVFVDGIRNLCEIA